MMNEQTEQPSSHKNEATGKPSLCDVLVCTGFGAGFSPIAPGTAGAAAATAIWCIYTFLLPEYYLSTTITVILIAAGTLLSIAPINRMERFWGEDASRIVIDEMVGVWITLLVVPPMRQWYYIAAAFLLFRIYDILKPWGCRWLDKNVHGGWGVMLDDILAGIYGALTLFAARQIQQLCM